MAPGHDHDGPDGAVASDRVRRWLIGVVLAIALAALAGLVVLRPSGDLPPLGDEFGFAEEQVDATVQDTDVVTCANTDPADRIFCEEVVFEVTSGVTEGEVASFEQFIDVTTTTLEPGDRIVLRYDPTLEESIRYRFADHQRDLPLIVLAAAFALAVVALGRFQGLRALVGLAISIAVLLAFVLPAILDGRSPVAVALVGSAVIAFVTLYLAHGVNERTTVALIGAFASLGLTGLLAWVFVGLSTITGFAEENAALLQAAGGQVDLRGLVLAGVVVGALGVLDDVTVTQVSAVWQLDLANPDLGWRRLYRSAIAIGRDHIASVVNTLVLAYAGAALPLLLIFSQAGRPVSEWVTSELIATEVIRTLVGSIGLVASVPITTALAVLVVSRGGLRPDGGEGPAQRRRAREEPAAGAPPVAPPAAEGDPGWEQFAPEDDLDEL